ncbi:RNA polymerase sigma factor [Winogradskyella sp.]|uniref:RNA polymerase sigma factor n=1 Tax=Winogradskyella sp. TaxID=1883156 RepID=UPI00260D58E5|nr:RNA polymerase sigma factor [Winogradskyella sp.]
MNQLPTDEELMTRVSQGDLNQMSLLFERYHLRLFNFLVQMTRDRAVAEDLTQTVFYKAIRYRSSYKGGQFVSWIFRIARNLFSDYYQKSKRSWKTVGIETVVEEQDESLYERTEEIAHLYNTMQKLTMEEREFLVLNRFQGLKYSQIAEITGSSEGAVKVRMHRVIKKLKTLYFETI